MFPSNSLDKNCIGPDCSTGRSNASNRFPVGITSLGDENQQIRIQLAVHKYNSSANSALNNRCGVISPYRHSFLNNSLKGKSYEGEAEGTSKREKRNGNQYEGVGAFPTIHLKKSAVRYRPIRRLNNAKISYPELPVNRFLSNLPEACSDVKSSTRSVLDVLEDLSGKKIHSKDDNGSNKSKSKGLGGDLVLNQNTVYKPLFVQKPKISSVLTRDNTTQTLSGLGTDVPSPQSSNSSVRNDASDPRAELRRKLAKQNNEIFASLSSSISSYFSLKRKIEKVAPSGSEENVTDGSATKNPKIDHQPNNYNGNGILKSASTSRTHSSDANKPNRKNQSREANSHTSPNKDRLTTIFLDLQDTSRKAQIFLNDQTLPGEGETVEVGPEAMSNPSNGFAHTSNGVGKTVSSSLDKSSGGGGAPVEDDRDRNGVKSSSNSVPMEKSAAADLKKPEVDQVSKPMFNLPVGPVNALNNVTKSSPPTFQFGIGTGGTDFSGSKKSLESSSKPEDSAKRTDGESNSGKDVENAVPSKPFVFGSSSDKPDFSSFKFGAPAFDAAPKVQNAPEVAPVPATNMPMATPQFSFGVTPTAATSTPQAFTPQFNATSAERATSSPSKPLFTFGQNPQQSSDPKPEEKPTGQSNASSSVATTAQSSLFTFGEKPNAESPVKTTAGSAVVSEASPTCQSTTLTFSPSASNLSTSSATVTAAGKPAFTFGQSAETPATSSTSSTTTQEPKFTFSFGQKSDVDQNKPQEEFGAKSTNLFSFGQKSIAQETQSTAASTNVISPSQPTTAQTTSAFGQNVSQAATSSQMKFGSISTPQITNNFAAKSEAGTLGSISTPAFTQSNTFPMKTPLFTGGFGNATTQASTGSATSTSNGPSFSFVSSNATQSAPTFGVSTAPQTAPTFATPSTTQSLSGFGSTSTTQSASAFGTSAPAFGVPSTTQSTSTFPVASTTQSGSTFGAASTTQSVPAFGSPSISQSTPSFGISSTTQATSTFGVSSAPQSTLGFGAPSTTQPTPAFTPSPGFGVSTSSQLNAVFGAPTQSAVRFGAAVTQNNTSFGSPAPFSCPSSTQPSTTFGAPSATSTSGFGTSQPSFSQPFNKPTTSLRQTPGIFGQNPAPSFSSGTTFNSNQRNVFGQKPSSGGDLFDQNKIQTPGFGMEEQPQRCPRTSTKFTFGMSTSNATGFTNSPPNTTSPPVFSFGASTTANTFTFGGGASMSSNAQTPFAFKGPTNEPFKFGATTAKDGPGPGFGGSSSTFNFGGQMNSNNNNSTSTNAMTEQKPQFNFGSAQVSSSAPFAFGTTPSPSVFSFGGSTSSGSGSGFNFGTPTPGGPFGQTPQPSSGAPFSVPGTFSIGSGSSQSRPRATSRPRRRQ